MGGYHGRQLEHFGFSRKTWLHDRVCTASSVDHGFIFSFLRNVPYKNVATNLPENGWSPVYLYLPVGLGACHAAGLVFGHRVVPEEEVVPHSLHRGVTNHVRRVPEVRVHGRADEVCDVGPHAPLRGEVVDADTALLHQLDQSRHTRNETK